MKTKTLLLIVFILSLKTTYGFPGELKVRIFGTSKFDLTVTAIGYSWSWENNKVIALSSYNHTYQDKASVEFDAPKDQNADKDVMPWGRVNFSITYPGFEGNFIIDFTDENWSQSSQYSSPDTYILISEDTGIIYLSQNQVIETNEDLNLNVNPDYNIWTFWGIINPDTESFLYPVILQNRIEENPTFDFGYLNVASNQISSGDTTLFNDDIQNTVTQGSTEEYYSNKRHYSFKWAYSERVNQVVGQNIYDPNFNFSITDEVFDKWIRRNFRTVWPLTIKNNLIESNQSSFGDVWFKDPTTPNEFELKSASGDGYVDNEAFNNLNEIINNQPNQRYSVKAVNSFSANGRNYYWFNGDFNPENGTDILVTGETTRTANFKGTQLSNDFDAFNTNSQRKFIKSDDGYLHKVYQSLGHIWYEISADNGQTWEIMNDGKPLNI